MNNVFPSKILWFGEHSVIKGSKALAVPYSQFNGRWEWQNKTMGEDPESKQLLAFADYLIEGQQTNKGFPFIDGASLKKDLQNGLQFVSTIPRGYGLGSSGALCAAIYSHYAEKDEEDFYLGNLKYQLGLMESFFHGSSSGTDPLVCYLQKAIVIEPGQAITPIELHPPHSKEYHFFLLDTKIPRTTGTWVNHFLDNYEDKHYKQKIDTELLPLTDKAIELTIVGDYQRLFKVWEELSYFQYQFFNRFIPKSFRSLWLEALGEDHFRLKLCGAGGGGFLLGMSKRPIPQLSIKYPLLTFHSI